MAPGSPTGWWHLSSSCCCWLCPGALLTVPGTSVICNWFSRAAHHKHAHTHWCVPKHTCGLAHTWGPLHAPQQPGVRPAAALTHKSHVRGNTLHAGTPSSCCMCAHAGGHQNVHTHAGVHAPTSRFHPGHVRGAHRPARARRCARRSLPCPAVLKSWSSSWLPLGPLVPAVPSHGDLSATCPRAARSLPVPPKPHAGCCTEPGGSRRAPRPRKLCTARGLSGGARSCSSAAKGWGDMQAGVEASCVP